MTMTVLNVEEEIDLIARSGLFDGKWYLGRYPDVALTGLNPVEHYVRYGVVLGRDPSARFSNERYIRENPDVVVMGQSPLAHYIRFHKGVPDSAGDEALVAAGVRGYLDRADSAGVSGWAVHKQEPGKAVELALYVDDEHFADLETAAPRPDLARLGLDGSKAGFHYSPGTFAFPKGAALDVRLRKTGRPLSRSPRVVADGPGGEEYRGSLYFDAYSDGKVRDVAVIIPVFNAYDAVRECLESVAASTRPGVAVVVINDCSTDPRIAGLLEDAGRRFGFRVVTNEQNLGYTRTVNKGLSLNPECDVILLNSDTVVNERWVEALRFRAYDSPRVATVTALSNNAGAFSVPVFGQYNPVPEHLAAEQMARIVTIATPGVELEVPTGNGFCMYMRREAIQALGNFDEQKYPRGYGEENDFCMRALRAGWRNLVCDKAFVFHKRSQSFQGEKTELSRAGGARLEKDYPEYRIAIGRFRDAQFGAVRSRIARALETIPEARALPAIMFVVSTQTGGTPQTNLDLMRAVSDRYRCLLLRCDSKSLTVSELVDGQLQEREQHFLANRINPVTHVSAEYDRRVADIMHRHVISLLHIRHIAWHSMNLPFVARSMGIGVVYSFHDFYSVCPSLNLLDDKLAFCGGRCTAGGGECQKSLWPQESLPTLKHGFVTRWQEMFRRFLEGCDHFVTTAESVAATLVDIYPELDGRIQIVPHGREFPGALECASGLSGEGKIRVLVPGNIGVAKGSELLREMLHLPDAEKFEFHFLGAVAGNLRPLGVQHGPYDRSSFSEKVAKIKPAFGVVLSVCAETYCHTLTEMWACGLPVAGFDIGAVGDRVRKSGAGWLLPRGAGAREVLDEFARIAGDPEGYAERVENVRRWQRSEARWNDTRTMAQKYLEIYSKLLGKEPGEKWLGMLHLRKPYIPPTAHIRLLSPWKSALSTLNVSARPVSAEWLLGGGTRFIDGLVIQRNAVSPGQVGELVETLAAEGLPYVYEIDDLLWELPEYHNDHAGYVQFQEPIQRLIRGATMVVTSTEPLRERILGLNSNVMVVPNTLDPSNWREPIGRKYSEALLAELDLHQPRRRILYMGTASHQADLEMIEPALRQVMAANKDVEFVQIGGGAPLQGARYIEAPREGSGYPDFVKWFRVICSSATIGLAPLLDSSFNRMKSDIKLLDYGLARLPSIFSKVVPYSESVTDGETGLLVENGHEAWAAAMNRLLSDQALRSAIANGAEEYALSRRMSDAGALIRGALGEIYGWRTPQPSRMQKPGLRREGEQE